MSEVNKSRLIRNIVAVIGGLILATLAVYFVEKISHAIWPPPELPEGTSPAQALIRAEEWLKAAPLGAMLMMVLGNFIGAVVGVWFAFKMHRDFKFAGVLVGALFLLLGFFSWVIIPHPFWYMCVDFIAILAGIVIPWRALKS